MCTAQVPVGLPVYTEQVPVGLPVYTEEVPLTPPAYTEEVPVGLPASTEQVPVGLPASTEEVPVGLPVSTEQVPVGVPVSTEEVSLTYCKISEFLRLFPIFSRRTLFRQVEQGKINVRRDIQSGLSVRPYELAIYSMETREKISYI